MNHKITVIIPTMNRFNSLKNTIESFNSADICPDQIIIVDQSGADNCELIKSYVSTLKNAIYIHQDEPSLTKARNAGFNFAKNEIIICSDDDVNVHKDTLSNIVNIMSDETVSLIAGVNELEKAPRSILGYFLGFKSFFKRKIGHISAGIFGRFPTKIGIETKTMWAMGFFFVIRKSLVEKWNIKWDENLKSYGYPEDLDFSYSYYKMSQKAGLRCIMSNKVVVKHLNSQEYRIPSRQSTFMYVLHRAYLYKKHNLNYYHWIMFNVSNYAMLIRRKIRKENPGDLKDALKYLRKHKKEVFEGRFYYGT